MTLLKVANLEAKAKIKAGTDPGESTSNPTIDDDLERRPST